LGNFIKRSQIPNSAKIDSNISSEFKTENRNWKRIKTEKGEKLTWTEAHYRSPA
jgi:hypothetical protein